MGSDLVSAYDEQPSKLILPLDGDWLSYDCEIEFTRRQGDTGFNLIIPHANGTVGLVFDVDGTGGLLLYRDGEQFSKRGYSIITGERTKVRVNVTRTPEEDVVNVFYNERFEGSWTGDLDSIKGTHKNPVPQNRHLSLWNNGKNEFAFHSIRVRILDGSTAMVLRPATVVSTAADVQQTSPPAVDELRKEVDRNDSR